MGALHVIAQTSLDGFVAGTHVEFDHFIGGKKNMNFELLQLKQLSNGKLCNKFLLKD